MNSSTYDWKQLNVFEATDTLSPFARFVMCVRACIHVQCVLRWSTPNHQSVFFYLETQSIANALIHVHAHTHTAMCQINSEAATLFEQMCKPQMLSYINIWKCSAHFLLRIYRIQLSYDSLFWDSPICQPQ